MICQKLWLCCSTGEAECWQEHPYKPKNCWSEACCCLLRGFSSWSVTHLVFCCRDVVGENAVVPRLGQQASSEASIIKYANVEAVPKLTYMWGRKREKTENQKWRKNKRWKKYSSHQTIRWLEIWARMPGTSDACPTRFCCCAWSFSKDRH